MNTISNVKLSWKKNEVPTAIADMLNTLSEEYPISEGGRGLKLKFKEISSPECISRVTRSKGEVKIEYSSLSGAARGIGSALSKLEEETSTPFRSLGIMLDVSRGMVMRVEHLKKWLRRLALSGYNQVLLYCEDIYELDDEPFFGAFRGAYSLEELQEIDAYAATLGIEMVGCIQTLAHLEQMLRHPVYADIQDTPRIMMVGDPRVHELVDKMIAFWSKAFRSRRIHIGMDEAHGLGLGRYHRFNPCTSGFDLMTRHLKVVSEICAKHGLDPMMWSDMFFRLTNTANVYYDTTSPFPADLASKIDPAAQLVYWDYYHQDKESYKQMIRRHRDLGKEPIMGSGIWTWVRLWYDHNKTMLTATPCIEACREEKVSELFFTMWGDDGAYCEYDSSLAGIVRCGDMCWGEMDENASAQRFEATCFADYAAQIAVSDLHRLNIAGEDKEPLELHSQSLLWDDPLLGIAFDNAKRANPEFDLQLLDVYDEILCRIMPHLEENEAGNIAYAVAVVKFLMRKLELRGALEAAYDSGDRLALHELATTTIPAALTALYQLDGLFREIWLARSKAFGLENIQSRNATQAARLEELILRINEYLDGQIDTIEELEGRLPWSAKSSCLHIHRHFAFGMVHVW